MTGRLICCRPRLRMQVAKSDRSPAAGPFSLRPAGPHMIMQVGLIGLGRMGVNVVRRLRQDGHGAWTDRRRRVVALLGRQLLAASASTAILRRPWAGLSAKFLYGPQR